MTNPGNNTMTHADLERLLDVYGSDRTRWPVEARTGAGHLVARDRAARRLLAESEALDRVLERAPLPSLAREAALADRIITAAQRSPRIVRLEDGQAPRTSVESAKTDTAPNVIRWPGGGQVRQQWQQLSGQFSGQFSGTSRIAGLMAACLLVGIYIGLSNLTQGALENMASAGSGGSTTLALLDPLDEDLL